MVAVSQVMRNDGDGNRYREGWTDLRYKLKVESKYFLMDQMLEVKEGEKSNTTSMVWARQQGPCNAFS